MLFPALDLSYIGRQFESVAPAVVEASRSAGPASEQTDHSPAMQLQAMHRLLELLQIMESRVAAGEELVDQDVDLNELGDYAIQLLADLAAVAGSLKMAEQSRTLEDLSLPMALWIARHGGELRSLEPVINALARLANTLREPSLMAQLYEMAVELREAVESMLKKDLEKNNPGRPWRLLLMNQAIIATRSHQTELMEDAYRSLTEALPEEAPGFFQEGMQQMEALDYPQAVRLVMKKYYDLWCLPRTLH